MVRFKPPISHHETPFVFTGCRRKRISLTLLKKTGILQNTRKKTYQTRQMPTPTTRISPFVKVSQQQLEAYEDGDEAACANEPPSPPEGFPALEEAKGLFGKDGHFVCGLLLVLGGEGLGIDGSVGGLALACSGAQRLGRVDDADAEDEAHEEAANVREVVEAGEEADDKGNGHVEEDEE